MVIILNGSINSGKTTIGQRIASLGLGFAHVEVDSLRHFIRWMPLEQSIPINLINAVSVVTNFYQQGIHSVMTMPLSTEDYRFLVDQFDQAGIDHCAIALFPGVQALKQNRGSRELTEWELNRIDELIEQGLAKPSFGSIIDNSKLSIEETTLKVLTIAGVAFKKGFLSNGNSNDSI